MNTLESSVKMYACKSATNNSSMLIATPIRSGGSTIAVAAEGEDEADERKQYDVPRRHVREQTDRERERLCELSDDLNRRHDDRHRELDRQRLIWRPINDRPPIIPSQRSHPAISITKNVVIASVAVTADVARGG